MNKILCNKAYFNSMIMYKMVDLSSSREEVLHAVRKDGMQILNASPAFWSDREIILEVVKADGILLRIASADLRADREIVLEAVKSCDMAFRYATDDLKADREIVLEAVNQDAQALLFISNTLKKDDGFYNWLCVIAGKKIKNPFIKDTYYYSDRYHAFAATIEGSHLRGDELKKAILCDFKNKIMSVTTKNELITLKHELSKTPEYKCLLKGQGIITRLFFLNISSKIAFDLMVQTKEAQLESLEAYAPL